MNGSPLVVLFPLFLVACSTPERRCHEQADLDACLTLCDGTDVACFRDLAATTPSLSAELLDRGCSHRDTRACVELAELLDGPERIQALGRACDLDSPDACRELSDSLVAATPPDWLGATAAIVRECHLLGLRGCVDADRMEARYLFQTYCADELRLPEPSCSDLDPDGSYGPPDRDLYIGIGERLRAACEARAAGACALGAEWSDAGFARFKAPSPVEEAWFRERE
ncbi:MAG: hypothetical protein ABH877_02630 [bacterium]